MGIPQWKLHLLEAFSASRQQTGAFGLVLAAEHDHAQTLRPRFPSYYAMLDGFQIFLAETLVTADSKLREVDLCHHPRNYGVFLLTMTSSLQEMRAASFSLTAGYPMPAYVLLRNIKDRALLLGAVGNRYTTVSRAKGLEGAEIDDETGQLNLRAVHRDRMREERRILDAMLRGESSGLAEEARVALTEWERLFNEEVHGGHGFISLDGIPWMLGREPLPVAPAPKLQALTLFMNCAWEVAWLQLRLLPLLQLGPGAFGARWQHDWQLLDNSFTQAANGLTREGKPIGKAIIELVERKFSFSPELGCYVSEMG